jgi:DNA-binding GntR family transcriptional regulator
MALAQVIPFPETVSAPRRRTAAALICDQLRDAIVALRLAPGAPLVEKELTEAFGVSRTPVREALIRLAEEGLVDIRPQSGTFVARIPLASIPEAVIIRQALEGTTVALAAEAVAGGAECSLLDEAIARQEAFAALGDMEAFHGADEAFHEAFAALAGHPGLWRVTRSAKLQIDRCRRLTLPAPGRMLHVIAEHRIIRDAVQAGDAPAARAAMQAHLQAVLPDAAAIAEDHPDFFV